MYFLLVLPELHSSTCSYVKARTTVGNFLVQCRYSKQDQSERAPSHHAVFALSQFGFSIVVVGINHQNKPHFLSNKRFLTMKSRKDKLKPTKLSKSSSSLAVIDDCGSEASERSCVVVTQPEKTDILCGKDKSCVLHEGSVYFRKVIDQYRDRYCSDSTNKQEKMNITREIVAKLNKTSRFLKYDQREGVWKTISALAARDKVGSSTLVRYIFYNSQCAIFCIILPESPLVQKGIPRLEIR